jgi:hypothetical protein|tara:strand:- start:12496 stop:12750 length:255 start_codon:yes stop_codon:yes gene_type:complete
MDEWLDLVGSIIRQAALDYRLAVKKGYIANGRFVKWRADAWMSHPDTVTSALTFWHRGGLEDLCEYLPVEPSYVRKKYEISRDV